MTLHADKFELRCHICGYHERVPTSCPVCNNASIVHKGIGTKSIESEIAKIFPSANIKRFDSDSKETLDTLYDEIYDGNIDILIGTQIVAKGLDLPHLKTVGIIQADTGLGLPDFTTSERIFQLLAQVVGRVGRGHDNTSVIVQSFQPNHMSITHGLSQNYADFYQKTLAERRRANFPPFSFLLKISCSYKTEVAAVRNARLVAQKLRQQVPRSVEILGPTPAFHERKGGMYRWQLVLKSRRRSDLVDALQHLPAAHWQFDLDPNSLM